VELLDEDLLVVEVLVELVLSVVDGGLVVDVLVELVLSVVDGGGFVVDVLVELVLSVVDEGDVVVTVLEVGDVEGGDVVVDEYTVDDELDPPLQGSWDSRS